MLWLTRVQVPTEMYAPRVVLEARISTTHGTKLTVCTKLRDSLLIEERKWSGTRDTDSHVYAHGATLASYLATLPLFIVSLDVYAIILWPSTYRRSLTPLYILTTVDWMCMR